MVQSAKDGEGFIGRGTTRAEDAQGTTTQSHIPPSLLVHEEEKKKSTARRSRNLLSFASIPPRSLSLSPRLPKEEADLQVFTSVGGVPLEQKMLKEHLPRVIHHHVY